MVRHTSANLQTVSFSWFRKLNPWVFRLLLVGVLGTTATVYLKTQKPAPQQDLMSQTIPVQTQDWVVQIQANGVVQATQKINLSPEESGRIAQLFVTEGDRVQQGQIIAQMDSERIQAQVNQYAALLEKAKADLELKRSGTRPEEIAEAEARVMTTEAAVVAAQARLNRAAEELDRYQLLVQEGAVSQNSFGEFVAKQQEARANLAAELARLAEQQESLHKAKNGLRPQEIEQAAAEVAYAEAQLAVYQSQLDNTVIRAPFAGIITRCFAQAGDFVTPTTSASSSEGATSTSIAELSSGLEIEAKLAEATIAKIYPGQMVDIQTDTYANKAFKGEVSLIAPRAVQENNITSFRVKVALSTGQDMLKSGMNVKLTFLSEPIKNALVIPLATVVTQPDGQTGVYVVDADQVRFQPIQVSATSSGQVQVLAGLKRGDRVLISPPSDEKIEGVDTVGF